MADVFSWLLVTLDPVNTSLRTEPPIKANKRGLIVLKVLSSGPAVDVDKSTDKIDSQSVNRNFMPTTIHEILIFGSLIVEATSFPVGLPSEETQETKNNDIERFAMVSVVNVAARVTWRIFHWLWPTSDLVITSLRTEPPRTSKSDPTFDT